MADLISRAAAIDELKRTEALSRAFGYHAVIDAIEALPPVDAVPVVHGRWIDETFTPWGLVHHPYKCDQCGDHSEAPSNYCPNCGTRMDGKDGEEHG